MCAFGFLTFGASTAAGNGCITPAAGSPGDPFLIQNIGNLECLRDNGSDYWHRGYNFEQTANIDLTGSPWSNGIGDDSDTFDGTYNGNGFSIANLVLDDTTKAGLFTYLSGAAVLNLTLIDPQVTSRGAYAGALAGYADDTTVISGVHAVDGGSGPSVLSGGNWYGGLVGAATGGTSISDSSSAAAVGGGFTAVAGGLVGIAQDASIARSFATGAVSAFGAAGGLVGSAEAPVTISQSYATGAVSDSLSGAGGLIGIAVTDDTSAIAIDQSFATGSTTSSNGPAGGLVGKSEQVGPVGLQQLVVTDSYASGTATGRWAAGGIVGEADALRSPAVSLVRTYAVGLVDASDITADDSAGGLLGSDAFSGATNITSSFWNPTDSGPDVANAFGTESTRGAMTSASLYSTAGWSISDTAPAATTWVSCSAFKAGLPVLQWYAAIQGWSCSPTPPPVYPPTAPVSVTGVAGDESSAVSWSTPTSSGSFPISTYQALSTPSGGSCLSVTTTCEVGGLTNGVAYSFRVRALNGAGWGSWSAPSAEITPSAPVAKSIVITGSRGVVRGRPGIKVSGSSTLAEGAVLRPWMKFPGQQFYTEGSAQIPIDANGDLQWQRRTGKKIYVFVSDDSARSNMVTIR